MKVEIVKSTMPNKRHTSIEFTKSFDSLVFTQPSEPKKMPRITPENEMITALRSVIILKYVSDADIKTSSMAIIRAKIVPLIIPFIFIVKPPYKIVC